MTNRLLVPLSVILENSNIQGNAEPSTLAQAEREAMRIDLTGILGTNLFDLFANAVQADGTLSGISTIQATFYSDHIVPLLSKQTEAVYMMTTHYQISNVGIQQTKSDNTAPASDSSVRDLHKRALNVVDEYASRAKAFILAEGNETDLADIYYQCPQNVRPQTKTGTSGIYTGRYR